MERRTELNEELKILEFTSKNHFLHNGLDSYQKDLYWRLETNPLNAVLKSRKLGISFFYGGFAALKSMRRKKVGIISQSQSQASRVGQFMDDWINGFRRYIPNISKRIVEHNKSHLLWDHGGEVSIMPNSSASVRSAEFDYLLLDEWAHFLHGTDQRIWEAIIPSMGLSEKMSVCVNSTPWGEGNLFDFMYHDRKQYPDFVPVFYHYSECPRLMRNIDLIKRNMDSLSFQQEFEGAFIGDMNTYFPYSLTREVINQEIEYVTDLSNLNVPLFGFADIGRRRDFTAIVLLANINNKLRLVYKKVLKTQEEKEWDNQYKEFRFVLSLPNLMRFGIDNGFGQQLVETMCKEKPSVVVPFTFTNDNKNEMFPMARKRMETKGIEMPEDVELINSLHMIQRTQSGNTVSFGSDKHTDEYGHADLAVALVGAIYLFERDGKQRALPRAIDSRPTRFGYANPRLAKR